jgi:MFS family permease
MTDAATSSAEAEPRKAPWGDLLRGGRALYTMLVILGVTLHALQILVTAIIMPTVVADIGGAAYYTWPAMLYTIGAIVGAASVGPLWAALGARRGYALSAIAFLAGTVGSAIAPDMAWLIAARGAQGLAGGLIVGGGMAMVSGLFSEALRTRILALYQGMWMVAQLLGPVVGGAFAEIGWWRGSFWSMVPIILGFAAIAWFKLPDRLDSEAAQKDVGRFPVMRLSMLTGGVFCIAAAGPAQNTGLRLALVAAAIGLIWLTFRRDRAA